MAPIALVGFLGCQRQLEFADWDLQITESTRVIEHRAVSISERTAGPTLHEELAIGDDVGGAEYSFYRPIDLAVDSNGRIYVADSGNYRIQVFSPAGRFIQTIGRRGWGPGELDLGGRITVSGDRLVRSGTSRLTFWRLNGALIEEKRIEFAEFLYPIYGTFAGHIVGSYARFDPETGQHDRVVRVAMDGTLRNVYTDLRKTRPIAHRRPARNSIVEFPYARPALAVAQNGTLYATTGAEYQIVAFRPSGEQRWALRVNWERLPVTESEIDRAIRLLQRRVPAAKRAEVDWPEKHPALSDAQGFRGSSLRLDGHGHLYVFPFVRAASEESTRPVDIYSSTGDLLYAGMIENVPWFRAHEDFVYAFRQNGGSEEQEVVRYRLVEPF